ncbi:MAG TPA: hypothetical protein VN461_04660 [Vicinamibacteria bacterium]|jgi:hypothetical protein|nr:hypothetical protein [Vicinamibacteria bacterium]
MEIQGLGMGTHLKEVATQDVIYRNCSVIRSDVVGLLFEVQRTITDAGGDVEHVHSQLLIPWASITYVLLAEEKL